MSKRIRGEEEHEKAFPGGAALSCPCPLHPLAVILSGATTETLHLAHQCVLSLFDSPVMSQCVTDVFLEVKNLAAGVTHFLRIDPGTRPPRTLLRFLGVITTTAGGGGSPSGMEGAREEALIAVVREGSSVLCNKKTFPYVFVVSSEDPPGPGHQVLQPRRFGDIVKDRDGGVAVVVPVHGENVDTTQGSTELSGFFRGATKISLTRYAVAPHISCSRFVLGL